HPFVKQKSVSLEELSQAPFLMRENGSGTRLAIERFMEKKGVNLNIKMTIESNEAIKHSVMSGLGVSILSAHTLAFGGNMGLAQLQVESLPINSNWYFLWLKSKRQTAIAQAFLQHVESDGRRMLVTELSRHSF
ncbi:LysR substrate-binding domain-containing protein, partial [Shewanella sp. GutDb-MelDb]|uniref:LysR substrate-binding domain-containing protein n=3 Tax=Shewanella TaxID=22 RepID=UPI000CB3E089